MTPERWRAITEIFHGAIAQEMARRDAFLAEACKHDASLKTEVEAMLAAHDAAGSLDDVALPGYDSTRDGRFLMLKGASADSTPTELHVVLNWFEELRNKGRADQATMSK